MKMCYLNGLLAILIGFSVATYKAEVSPIQQSSASINNGEISSVLPAADTQPIVVAPADNIPTITTSDGQKIPILIGFDRNLCREYCESRENAYRGVRNSKLVMLAVASVVIGMQVNGLIHFPYIAKATAVGSTISSWWALSLSNKVSTLFWSGIPKAVFSIPSLLWSGFQTYSAVNLASSSMHNLKTIGSDDDNLDLWGNRAALLQTTATLDAIQEMQSLWHQHVYALFGSPEVIGTKPATGKYLIKGYKKYGAGIVIFDPFDREQVKILLGIGRANEDLRCSKIEIITA